MLWHLFAWSVCVQTDKVVEGTNVYGAALASLRLVGVGFGSH
jgi:FlaA1/EpsC-like NDP-sugar epimerase